MKTRSPSLVLSEMNHVVTPMNCHQILVFNVRKRFRNLKLTFYFDNCNLHLKFECYARSCYHCMHLVLSLFIFSYFLNPTFKFYIVSMWTKSLDVCALCDVCCCLHVITCKLCQLVMGVGLSTCELLRRFKGFISNICKDKFSRLSLLCFWFFKLSMLTN
jgi:hypothetical protein